MRAQDRARQIRPIIERAAESLSDGYALECVELTEPWAAGIEYPQGKRLRYCGKLYRVRQKHTSQADWIPSETPSLYAEVAKPSQGDDPSNPIPYDGNMELTESKYYSQSGIVYICTRSTGVPVYNALADLVHIYVEVVS